MKTFFLALLLAAGFLSQAQTVANNYQLLPENLAYFTAARTGKTVSLEWQTVNEQNSRGFNVQRKTGDEWEVVGFVPTGAVGGNSSVKVSYTYTDANSYKGITQYRVTEVTNDGKQRQSEIRVIKSESQAGKAMLYPNPSSNGRINIVFYNASPKDLLVADAAGRVVKQLSGITNTVVVVDNLQSGSYNVRVVDRTTNEVIALKALVTN